ncbi:MAG: hypothetical protein E6Q97_11105 [Desulfurellales bacterium]|nr:MAG: hypothetical protein E6Q97_11105 [Desulfurellales bacterium]
MKSAVGDKKQFEAWKKRIAEAEAAREKECKEVWQPLFDGLIGSLCRGQADADPVNGYAQFEAMVMPHYMGDSREFSFTPTRIWGGENAEEKIAAAERMGKQATALAKACGLYVDAVGAAGEMPNAMWNHLWGMGVIVVGFNPPKQAGEGNNETREQGEDGGPLSPSAADADEHPGQVVDLDAAEADHSEKADAGLPWARSYDPRRCVFDATFGDVRKARWFAVDVFRTVAECKKTWPQFGEQWRKTAGAVGDPRGGESERDGGGVVRLRYVYALDPLRLLIIPDDKSGVAEIVEERPLELGVEGLPVLLLGGKWITGRLFPKPALADGHGPAKAEIELMETARGATNKIRNAIITNDDQLAEELRKGDAHGVYVLDRDKDLKAAVKTIELPALRKELIDMATLMRENRDRNLGTSDMALAIREPGNPTATEASARQAAYTARLAGLVGPVRAFEGAVGKSLLAIAYQFLPLLDGMQLLAPGQQGSELVGFDVNFPMIGEMLDYAVDVHVSDAATNADEVQQLNNAFGLLSNAAGALQAIGKMPRLGVVAVEILRRSTTPRAEEMIVDLPPQPPMPAEGGQVGMGAGGNGAAPPQEPQPPDPQAELEQLYAALEQVPEGDPNEDAILQRIAELQAGGVPEMAAA